ncbi:aminotransferase class I/II-fold pyridoxal phosphate-dependent enzyme [Peptoniphilus sp. MSJ-1]|uniref:Aminotransferase class I/II-fold pyridoxal phosphate-dependent enzyme n=1 Tax=Peptoniphilus ovalis TaxID=2841503 RepID=A0ABS6FH44_9FIRM|nr:aminotransferase class I/II-fold pyridoxal phosphate-dependent enzyme [Peptoniphilus ovalis]MBU5668581.1 aminotransferase class I/II-fold pyridoxal phosphate-dependent enzyme [Peptoniphilus ovalis]
MNNFRNDYKDFGSPEIYREIEKLFDEKISGYGKDSLSNEARELIKKEVGRDADIEFISGGTAANILATTFVLRPYEAVLSCESGHITHHETGSIESTGHKVVTVHSEDGKIKPSQVNEVIKKHSSEVDVKIKLVYISQTTELGTVYSLDEIREIYKVCRENNLYLYIDGARLAHAMAANGTKIKDYAEICDVFTIGGTKNGAIFGEAMILVNDDMKENFRYYLKQKGAMMAKSFLIGLSFKVLFTDNLYYKNAKKAYEASRLLKQGLQKKNREIVFAESNQIFIKSSPEEIEKLKVDNEFEIENEEKSIIRLVTDYKTSDDDIRGFLESLI